MSSRLSPFVILLALITTLTGTAFGQSANRWLLVFDTSYPMRTRTKGVEASTRDLLATGMHGKIRPGDSIGIWTFSDKLHTGEMPLQLWSPEAGPTIIQHTIQFLGRQQYMNSGRLDVVMTNVLNLIQASDVITVFIFSDGSEPIDNTPFDGTINEVYKANYRQQKKTDMPVITVLRGERGYITTNTINLAPLPVDIPPVPVRVVTRPAPKPQVRPAAPPPALPPLIYDGKKEETPARTSPPATAPSASNQSIETEPATTQPVVEAKPETSAASNVDQPQPSISRASAVPPAESQAQSKPPAASKALAANSAPDPVAEAAAASTPQPDLFTARNIAILSGAFTVIVCGLLILSARRARATHASLITRSLDRESE